MNLQGSCQMSCKMLRVCPGSSKILLRRLSRIACWYCSRLNKIGKNPNLVSHREEDMGSESKTINAVVNALAEQAEQVNTSEESMGNQSSDKSIHELGRNLHELGQALHRLNLPRPKSENNFASQEQLPMNRTSRPIFHKSDTFHKDTSFQWHHWIVYVVIVVAAASVVMPLWETSHTFGKSILYTNNIICWSPRFFNDNELVQILVVSGCWVLCLLCLYCMTSTHVIVAVLTTLFCW